jgi:hypothetical protein
MVAADSAYAVENVDTTARNVVKKFLISSDLEAKVRKSVPPYARE